ncbi:unnamed protein product [Prunus armeniaca]
MSSSLIFIFIFIFTIQTLLISSLISPFLVPSQVSRRTIAKKLIFCSFCIFYISIVVGICFPSSSSCCCFFVFMTPLFYCYTHTLFRLQKCIE